MIKYLLLFRAKQFYKFLDRLGAGYVLLAIPLLIFPFLMVRKYAASPETAIYLSAGLGALLLYVHLQRKDLRFLEIVYDKPYKLLVFEYFILALPVLTGLFYYLQWLPSLLVLVMVALIPLAKKQQYKTGITEKLVRLLPLKLYEFRAGIRKQLLALMLLYASMLALAFLPYLTLLLAWFFVITISGLFLHNEQVKLLECYELPPKAFLWHKITVNAGVALLLFLPSCLPYLFFNPSHWWLVLIFVFLLPMFMAYTLVLKYSYYEPGETPAASNVFYTIGIFGIFVPFLLPLPLIIGLKRYFIAIKKLDLYLHDYR